MTLLKTFVKLLVILVLETDIIIKKALLLVHSPRQVITHFHSYFLFFIFPASTSDFFCFFVTF